MQYCNVRPVLIVRGNQTYFHNTASKVPGRTSSSSLLEFYVRGPTHKGT